jgi:hypothetical protein
MTGNNGGFFIFAMPDLSGRHCNCVEQQSMTANVENFRARRFAAANTSVLARRAGPATAVLGGQRLATVV